MSRLPANLSSDEVLLAGELQESSKKSVLRVIANADATEENELSGRFGLAPTKRPALTSLPSLEEPALTQIVRRVG